jgi:3-dehydroquinate dehydratase
MSNKPKRGIPENEPEPTIKDVLKQIQLLDVKNNKSITDMMKQQSDQLLKKIQDSQKKLKDEIKIDIAALTEKFDAVEENICSNNQQVTSISSKVIDLYESRLLLLNKTNWHKIWWLMDFLT